MWFSVTLNLFFWTQNHQTEVMLYHEQCCEKVAQNHYCIYLFLIVHFVISSSTFFFSLLVLFSVCATKVQSRFWQGYCKSDHPFHSVSNNRDILSVGLLCRCCWAEDCTWAILMYLWQRCSFLFLWVHMDWKISFINVCLWFMSWKKDWLLRCMTSHYSKLPGY